MSKSAVPHWLSWRFLMSTAVLVGGCSAAGFEPDWVPRGGQASAPDIGGSSPSMPPEPVRPVPDPGNNPSRQSGAEDLIGKGGAGTPPTTPIPGPPPPPGQPGRFGRNTPRPSDAIIQRSGGQRRPRI
jgi:hypothetical protein